MAQTVDTPSTRYDWNEDTRQQDLEALYKETCAKVQDNIDWYTRNARQKKRYAQGIRTGSLIILGIGTILPVIIDTVNTIEGVNLPSSIATMVLALGTGLIAFDRFMGYSTGWMRFITSELHLKSRLEAFQYQWELERIAWNGGMPTPEQAQMMATRCADLRGEVTQLVHDETQLWVQEFQSTLRFLDENFKTLVEVNRPGSIALTVENGQDCADGWEVYLNDRLINTCLGSTTALTNLIPGQHKLTVVGKNANGKINR